MGPIRITCTISKAGAIGGQEGKPESYYFPPQHNNVGNNFPYTFMGLEPGTTKAQVRQCLEHWNKGDNGILDLSRAYRLKPGSGWLIGPCILHAPGRSAPTNPNGVPTCRMYQSLVEGREVPWSLLVKDMPKAKHHDLDFIVNQLDWRQTSIRISRRTTTWNRCRWPTLALKVIWIAGSFTGASKESNYSLRRN